MRAQYLPGKVTVRMVLKAVRQRAWPQKAQSRGYCENYMMSCMSCKHLAKYPQQSKTYSAALGKPRGPELPPRASLRPPPISPSFSHLLLLFLLLLSLFLLLLLLLFLPFSSSFSCLLFPLSPPPQWQERAHSFPFYTKEYFANTLAGLGKFVFSMTSVNVFQTVSHCSRNPDVCPLFPSRLTLTWGRMASYGRELSAEWRVLSGQGAEGSTNPPRTVFSCHSQSGSDRLRWLQSVGTSISLGSWMAIWTHIGCIQLPDFEVSLLKQHYFAYPNINNCTSCWYELHENALKSQISLGSSRLQTALFWSS